MLEARFGPAKRVPDDVLREAVTVFVEELSEQSRGVWVQAGERLGVDWWTARMLVYTAADRGMIELSGTRTDLTARLPDGTVIVPPDSFPGRLATLERFVEVTGSAAVPRSTLFESVALGKWVESVKNRWRNGTLTDEQQEALEGLPGWRWPEPGRYSGGSVPRADSDVGVNLENTLQTGSRKVRWCGPHRRDDSSVEVPSAGCGERRSKIRSDHPADSMISDSHTPLG